MPSPGPGAQLLLPTIVLVLLLLGCAGESAPSEGSVSPVALASIELKDAVPAAVELREGVIGALTQEYPEVAWSEKAPIGLAAQADGTCVLFLNGPSTTDDLFARSDRMRSLPALLTPILSARGYGPVSEPQEWSAGGGVDVAADGPGGWRFSVTGKGRSAFLTLKGPVLTTQCDSDALVELGSPR